MGKRELVALLNLSSWCLVMVVWLFLVVRQGCLQFVIVVFPDHTHLLFLYVACCHGNNKALASTWAQNEVWLTLNACNIT